VSEVRPLRGSYESLFSGVRLIPGFRDSPLLTGSGRFSSHIPVTRVGSLGFRAEGSGSRVEGIQVTFAQELRMEHLLRLLGPAQVPALP
jgi:hypothetical protein